MVRTTGAATTARGWVLTLTSIASLIVALDLLVVATALHTIRADLGTTIEQLQWTVTAYGLSFAGLLMAGASLGDRYGRRRVFVIGLGVFAAASAACALAPGVGWLIAARAVQGAGAALVMPLAVTLLTEAYPADRRGRALGIFEGVTGLATIAGPPVGGALAQALGWEWIFWVNVPIALVAILLVRYRVGESRGTGTGLDKPGLVLVTGGSLSLVWALVRSNSAGWASPEIVLTLLGAVVFLLLFVGWERRAREPMLPIRLFGSRGFSAGMVVSFLLFGALYGSVFFFAQFLQTGLGNSPLEAGLRLVPWTATLIVVAPLAGTIADRFGDRPVLVAGLAINGLGLGWIAVLAAPDVTYSALVIPLIVTGIGASAAIPVVQNVVLGAAPPDAVGKASGANSMIQELGGVFGVALLVAVFAAAGSYTSPRSFTTGFTTATGVCAALALVAACVALAVPARRASSA